MNKDSTLIISKLSRKLNLTIYESKKNILQKYLDFIVASFEHVTLIHDEVELLEHIKTNQIDFLFIEMNNDCNAHNFSLIKSLSANNPLLKTIAFTNNIKPEFYEKCFKNKISGVMGDTNDTYDLKEYIKNELEDLLLTNTHKFQEENYKKIDLMDCLSYLNSDDKKRKVSLISHYRGIPIVRSAKILNFNDNELEIQADKIQIKTLNSTDHVVVSSIHLGLELYLKILNINSATSTIKLQYSKFLSSYIHRRKNPRVEPKVGSNATVIIKNNHNLKLDILNVSIDHVLCKVSDRFLDELKVQSQVEIHLDCKFASQRHSFIIIKTKAIVKDKFSTINGNKVLFKYDLSFNDKKILDEYISKRSKEVLLELKNLIVS